MGSRHITDAMTEAADKVAMAVHMEARRLSPEAKKALTFADFERLTTAAHKAVLEALRETGS